MDSMIRREASIPVQSRIDIRTLAEICRYFTENNIDIRSASQLVSWSLEMLVQTLKINDKLPQERPSVQDSYNYLGKEGLMQKRMLQGKVAKGLAFEVLRIEGESPAEFDSHNHKMIHNNPNWTGGGDVPVLSEKDALVEAKRLQKEYKHKVDVKRAKEELEIQKANQPFEINTDGKKVFTSTGINHSFAGEDEYNKMIENDTRQEREILEKKEREKVERKRVKKNKTIQKNIDELKKQLEEVEGGEESDEEGNDDTPATRSYEEILEYRIKRDEEEAKKFKKGLEEGPGIENIVE